MVLALQWLMLLAPGLLVLGALAGDALGLDGPERVSLLQRLFLVTGLAYIVQ